MKKYLCIIFTVILSVCLLSACSDDEDTAPEIVWTYSQYVYNVNDKGAVMDFSDNTFIGLVVNMKETRYWNVSANPDDHPHTIYSVKVIKNIKGDLPIGDTVLLAKSGGLSKDKKKLYLEYGDSLLTENRLYVLNTRNDSGYLRATGAHTTIILEESVNNTFNRETLDPSVLKASAIAEEYYVIYDSERQIFGS